MYSERPDGQRLLSRAPTRTSEKSDGGRAMLAALSERGIVATDSGTRKGAAWALVTGDAKKTVTRLGDGTVDCVVTSPPYYWQRDYEMEGQSGQEETIGDYVRSLRGVFRQVKRVLKRRGVVFLNLGDTYYSGKGRPHGKDTKQVWRNIAREKYRAVDRPGMGLPQKSLIGIPWRVALALQQDGWIIRSAVRWHKPKGLAEPSARDRPWGVSETIFILAKSRTYFFDRKGLKGEEDVWTIAARPTKKEYRHAAAFPLALVERCLACGCPEKGVVLDPYVGSGTTVMAATDRRLSAIGIDLNPDYIDMAATRMKSNARR